MKNDVVGSGWNTVESLGTYWYPFAFDWAVEHNLTTPHALRATAQQGQTPGQQ